MPPQPFTICVGGSTSYGLRARATECSAARMSRRRPIHSVLEADTIRAVGDRIATGHSGSGLRVLGARGAVYCFLASCVVGVSAVRASEPVVELTSETASAAFR